jgi:hypothetical protein
MLALPAHAADKKASKEREAARRMQIMQQQFSSEKAALEKDKSELSLKVEELAREAESAKQGAAQVERVRSSQARDLAALKSEMGALQEKLRLSEKAHADLLAQQKTEGDKNQKQVALLQAAVAERGQLLGSCETKNSKLYELNREILAKYRDKGLLDSLAQSDALTGIRSVQVDNLLEDYRDKLDAERIRGAM